MAFLPLLNQHDILYSSISSEELVEEVAAAADLLVGIWSPGLHLDEQVAYFCCVNDKFEFRQAVQDLTIGEELHDGTYYL